MSPPAGYDGPKLEIIVRTIKPEDNTERVI